MPQALDLNTSARPVARLRSARVADGVVAAYIHELSRTQTDLADAAPRTPRAGAAAGRRFRSVARRRSHTGSLFGSLTAPAACPAA